jgi:putative hemolysin
MLTVETGDNGLGKVIVFDRRRGGAIRDLAGLPETLARIGSLELKLAVTKEEIRAVQKMRYRVFYEEGGATADPFMRARRRDNCPFDRICDHIIVLDHDVYTRMGRRKPKVVGAYRVLRQEMAAGPNQFYAAGEFDVARLLARHPDKTFLELGRSCVLPEYRARRVLELLWRGVWTYVRHHQVDVMFGCASLPGADPQAHAAALAFLRTHARAGEEWRVASRMRPRVREGRSIPTANASAPDRRALANLPPLIKGYLRLGAVFTDEVFVDHAFGTTDVLVVLPVRNIEPRYLDHFGAAQPERGAA